MYRHTDSNIILCASHPYKRIHISIGLSTNKRKRTIIMPTLLTSFVQDFIYIGSIQYPYAYIDIHTHGL